jgi:hypothetical protein
MVGQPACRELCRAIRSWTVHHADSTGVWDRSRATARRPRTEDRAWPGWFRSARMTAGLWFSADPPSGRWTVRTSSAPSDGDRGWPGPRQQCIGASPAIERPYRQATQGRRPRESLSSREPRDWATS